MAKIGNNPMYDPGNRWIEWVYSLNKMLDENAWIKVVGISMDQF